MEKRQEIAEAVRAALVERAVDAYEDAGIRGLCEEGRWEAAVDAIRSADLSSLLARFREPGGPGLPLANPHAARPADPGAAARSGPGADPGAGAPRPDVADDDLQPLLVAFYDTLERDPLLAPYFVDVDMGVHIPRIADFWSTILFRTRRYSDNAFAPHMRMPGLTADHFARWVSTLEATVDARFAGPAATLMKETAHRIAYSMQLRLGISPFAPYEPQRR